jgi:hypothetical protein
MLQTTRTLYLLPEEIPEVSGELDLGAAVRTLEKELIARETGFGHGGPVEVRPAAAGRM